MIEFTTLEITLLALCVILFFRNAHNATKARAMYHLVDAMCEDEKLVTELRKQYKSIKGGSV